MKQYFFILLITFHFSLSANEFIVKSFTHAQNDLTAIKNKRLDVNDEVTALIKVQTDLSDLFFDSNLNIVGDINENLGEYLVYLSPGEKMLQIRKEGFIPLHFGLPLNIESGKVYVLVLTSTEPVSNAANNKKLLSEFVIIDSDPQGASIYINDEYLGVTPIEKPMLEGSYALSIQLPNYFTHSRDFEVVADVLTKIFTSLNPKFGHLHIVSTPVANASIILNGNQLNETTPFTVEELQAGKHTININKKFYEPAFAEVYIEEGKTQTITLSLKPAFGIVNILVNPNTNIFLDNKFLATGMFYDTLTPGLHILKFEQENHFTETQQINVATEKTETLEVELKPITGTMSIVSQPSGANIFVDGQPAGKTPKFIRELIIGRHQVKLELDDYLPSEFEVTIEEDKTIEVDQTLINGFNLKIDGTPSQADVYVNGDLAGQSPATIHLKPAKHDLKISKSGYVSSNLKIGNLRQDTTIKYSLVSIVEKKQINRYKRKRNRMDVDDFVTSLFVFDDKNDNAPKYRIFYNYGGSHIEYVKNQIIYSHDALNNTGDREYFYTSVWDTTDQSDIRLHKAGIGFRKIIQLDVFYSRLIADDFQANGFGASLGLCTHIEESHFDFYVNGNIVRYFSPDWEPYEWDVTLGTKYLLGNAVSLEFGYVFSGWDLRNNDYVNPGETSAVVIGDNDNIPDELNQQDVISSKNYFKFGISINFGE